LEHLADAEQVVTSKTNYASDEQSQRKLVEHIDTGYDETEKLSERVATSREIATEIENAALEKLTGGLVKNCLENQQTVKKQLHDITESQRVILETLQQENAKFSECQILHEVSDVMEMAKLYHTKLLNIRKEMVALHEKSALLKRRAVKIQQEKQQEALVREQQRERELEKQRKLTAKMAKPSSRPT